MKLSSEVVVYMGTTTSSSFIKIGIIIKVLLIAHFLFSLFTYFLIHIFLLIHFYMNWPLGLSPLTWFWFFFLDSEYMTWEIPFWYVACLLFVSFCHMNILRGRCLLLDSTLLTIEKFWTGFSCYEISSIYQQNIEKPFSSFSIWSMNFMKIILTNVALCFGKTKKRI